MVVWDADFIVYTNAPNDIIELKSFLLDLDPKIYYRVHAGFVYLDGGLFPHQIWWIQYQGGEPFVSFGLRRLGIMMWRFELMTFLLYYRRFLFPGIYAVHLVTVKNASICFTGSIGLIGGVQDFQHFSQIGGLC